MDTVWILGDQLNRSFAHLSGRAPGDCRVLLVESRRKLRHRRWHRQRAHLVVTAMRRFAAELEEEGFEVDYRVAGSMRAGLAEHRARHRRSKVVAMQPNSWDARTMMAELDVSCVRSDQFLCHHGEFAAWAEDRSRLLLEDFYRWQRVRLDLLIEQDGGPAGGRWNFDADNREPPPADGSAWTDPLRFELDALDARVLEELPDGLVGDDPDGTWPTDRAQARRRLRHFTRYILPHFGPHQDAMLGKDWHLAHSLLSSSLNLGLLTPSEVCAAVERAYRRGTVPIASAEGFLRQVIGWREYVWGLYWLWMPSYLDENALGAERPLPPVLEGRAGTDMACLGSALESVRAHGYAHHIQRLMVLGNLGLLSGMAPRALLRWMEERFVDGAEWVMAPNVIGMALAADGGRMATKPYAAGGNYLHRMSDHCAGCAYRPRERTGDAACPFTTLYWDFLYRHREVFAGNHRLARPLASMRRLSDLDEVRARAREVLDRLDEGSL